MKLKYSLMSVCAAMFLLGCGGDDDPVAPVTPTVEEEPAVAKNSTVCLDSNENAICEASESSEKVITWDGKTIIEVGLSGDAPLAYNGENGYVFTAPAGFTKIYSGTTMINSELRYNQFIAEKTKEEADAYLHTQLAGSPNTNPTQEQLSDMADNFKKNVSLFPNEKRYAIIAAVVNKAMISPNDLKNISVSVEEIKEADIPSLPQLTFAKSISNNVYDSIKAQEADGWRDTKDSAIRYLSARNGKIVGGSHYHNSLSVLDTSTGNITFNPVSAISDHGHFIDSASGASENYLDDVVLSSDASYVYANISPKKSGSTSFDTNTNGLFKIKLNTDGSVSTTTTDLAENGKRISIDLSAGSFRLDPSIQVDSFIVSDDDSKVIIIDTEDNLRIYNSDLSTQITAIETSGVDSVGVYGDKVYLAKDNTISILSASDLSTIDSIALDFSPNMMRVSEDGTKLLAIEKDHLTIIAIIDLQDKTVLNKGEFNFDADNADITSDFTRIVLVGYKEKDILFINTTIAGMKVQAKYPSGAVVRDAQFLNNDQLAYVSELNGLAVLDISTSTHNTNLTAQLEAAKLGLNEGIINNGNFFDTVVKNMSLPTNFENISVIWESTLPTNNLNIEDGSIIRPEETSANVSGKLTAKLSVSFRGVEQTEQKEFALTIWKDAPQTQVASTLLLTNSFRGNYMSTNSNGKVASLNREGPEGGLYILSNTQSDLSFYVGDNNNSDGNLYHKFGGEQDGIAIAYTKEDQVVAVTNAGNIYRYSIGAKDSITQTQIISIANVTTKAAVFNTSETKLAILVSNANSDFITKVYDVSADGTIVFNTDIAMQNLSYNGEIAINDDASVIFARSAGDIINAQTSSSYTSHTIGERIRGLFYVNNTLYSTSSDGKLTAFAGGDLTAKLTTDMGHDGRAYVIKETGDKLFIFLYASNTSDGGISVVDKNTLKELHFIPAAKVYRGSVSADGKDIYTFSFTKPRQLSYIRLP